MAKKKINPLIPGAIIVGGLGVAYYWWTLRDKTPVGLVVTNANTAGSETLGVNEDGDTITMGSVEGTWRADKNSLSVASESAEKPLLVVYEDGTPIHAELITMSDWEEPSDLPEECEGDNVDEAECDKAFAEMWRGMMQKFRDLAKEHGVTEESMNANFPISEESTQSQEAETIYGPRLSLQSHFVWVI